MATLGFASSNEESCPINLVDDASLTIDQIEVYNTATQLYEKQTYNTGEVTCTITSDVLTFTLVPNDYIFDDYVNTAEDGTTTILNKIFELQATVQLPNPGSTDAPLRVTRTI